VHALIDDEVFSILDRSIEPGSLLAELRAATDEAGSMSRQQLRDEVVTLLLAGHETTALALTWALYLVALRPELDAALATEIQQVRPTGPIGIDDLEKLDLSGRVLKETLRLYPPAYVVPRVCAEPVDIGGYRIQPGSEVWLWIYFMHHDARWFRQPERFDPDRFLDGGEVAKNPNSYVPFGLGMRSCVGRHFAMLEAVIVLAGILRRFRVRCLDSRPLRPLPRITLAPSRPVRVRLEARR
jgi:cytochrome P450